MHDVAAVAAWFAEGFTLEFVPELYRSIELFDKLDELLELLTEAFKSLALWVEVLA